MTNADDSLVRFRCTHCEHEVTAERDLAGREIACPHCRAVLMVPAAPVEPQTPAVRAAEQLGVGQPEVREAPIAAVPSVADPVEPFQGTELPKEARAEQAVVEAPAARVAPRGATAPPPRVRRAPRYVERPAAGGRGTKTVILAASGVLVVVVAVVVGVTISRNMARAEKAQAVEGLVRKAQAAFAEGDLGEAAKLAESVEKAAKELAVIGGQLNPAQQEAREKTQQQITRYGQRLAELDVLGGRLESAFGPAKGVRGDSDFAGVKRQLADQKALLDQEGRSARPLLEKIGRLLQRAEELERRQKLDELGRELSAAEKTYLDGRVEESLEQARSVRTKLAADESLKDAALQKRLDQLREWGEQYATARRIRAGSGQDPAATRKKLEEMGSKLAGEKPEHKVLLAEIERLKKELVEEENKRVQLTSEQLTTLKRTAEQMAKRDPGLEVGQGTPTEGVVLRYDNQNLRLLGLEKDQKEARVVIEAAGYRFRFSEPLVKERPGVSFRIMQALGASLKEARAPTGRVWETQAEAPYPMAWSRDDSGPLMLYAGKLYSAQVLAPPVEESAAKKELTESCEALVQAVEKDATVSEEARQTVAVVVRGACKDLDPRDYLTGDFCRRVLGDGYIEQNIPGAAERYRAALERYRKAYAAFNGLSPQAKGQTAAGDEFRRAVNYEDHALLWSYDKQTDVTRFGIKHPVDDRKLLFLVYEFAGRHEQFPADVAPKAVQMVHPAVGVMASYDPKTGKLDCDEQKWSLGAAFSTYPHLPPWLGTPQWTFPPHVLLVDAMGNTLGLVTTAGRVDLPHFRAIKEEAARRAAQEKYLNDLARVLNTTGYLHLYFLYFHQYVLDSPMVTQTELLGSRAHSGDIHQNVYQSLDRELGGRYLGDCDDLAEMYMNLTRRQGKLSYVMSLPSHAACGWVEKAGDTYRLQFLDTGPPRIFEGLDIEKLVEGGSRTYDREKTMRFDPKSVPFLFRFAGELTRTPYWLSCRMFQDREYAEIMERVQSYWHFHFYALGIRTMEDMIGKGDRVPENCVELAGLYGRVRETKKSIQWTEEALKQLGKQDTLSRLSEKFRVGLMYREDQDFAGAYEAIKEPVAELKRLATTQEWLRYVSQRMDFAGLLSTIDRPFEGWDVLRLDVDRFLRVGQLRLEHGALMTNLFYKMKELEAEPGRQLSPAEKNFLGEIERGLDGFYRRMCFTEEDDFGDYLRKYAFIGRYYAAKQGRAKWVEELLKDGPYPEKERNHRDRSNPEAEDWKWIRLSPLSYTLALGDAVDPDDPPEKWHKEEAIKLAEALPRAAAQARKSGSLASAEFLVLSVQARHAFMAKKWPEFEDVLKEVKRQQFARLTADVAQTFGHCARFVTPQEFAAQYRVFAKYVDTRAPYFNVVYEAYRQSGYEHARAVAKVALERWPDDENMKREAKYLDELIQNRLKEKDGKKTAPKEPAKAP